jgi:hypothetical protein
VVGIGHGIIGRTQLPPWQLSSPPHLRPHAPQLFLSLSRSRQLLPQHDLSPHALVHAHAAIIMKPVAFKQSPWQQY